MPEIEKVKKLIAAQEDLVKYLVGKGDLSDNISICQRIAGLREYLRILEAFHA